MLNSPAAAPAKRLVELRAVRLLRRCADPIVEKLGILADENAPFLRLHAIQDDGCCIRSSRGRAFSPTLFQFHDTCPDLIVGIADDVDTLCRKQFARGEYVDRRLAALQNFP